MDDHHRWQAAYRGTVRREWAERGLVSALVLATLSTAGLVWWNWERRFEYVFHPGAGLSYVAPRMVNGVVVTDIADPLTYQKLAPNDAYAFNASVPVSTEPLTGSRPFSLAGAAGADAARALDCLTAAVYYEAASESLEGQRAVAQVVINRVRHPAFPNSVCGVVFSGSTRRTGCQFTFTCDGALGRPPSAGGWSRARAVAQAALSGQVYAGVGQATHYHTLWVAPYWSPSLVKVANIGAHTFYRWKGRTGQPGAFGAAYAGIEPVVSMTVNQTAQISPLEDESDIALLDQAVSPGPLQDVPVTVETEDLIVVPTSRQPESGPQETSPDIPSTPPTSSGSAPASPPASPERRRPRVATPDW